MDIATIKSRVSGVRRRLRKAGLDGLVVVGVENVRYLTGFCGHDSWALVLPRKVILITDSRYTEQAEGECVGCAIYERKGQMAAALKELLAGQSEAIALGIEDGCTAATLAALKKALRLPLAPVHHIVELGRRVKTPDEVKLIASACRIAFDAMDWAMRQLRVGMTERELAALYDYRLRTLGATPGFETIAAFGENGSRAHHQPSGRKLRANDTILLDFGARYRGYISDATRCCAVGTPSDFYCEVYRTVALAQRAAIAAVAAGVRVSEVDAAARQVIAAAKLPVYGHGTGHGIGLQIHEAPTVSGQDKHARLEAGQVITIEPAVYLPGRFGIRLEDDVLVTERGAKVLSRDRRFDIDGDAVPIAATYKAKPLRSLSMTKIGMICGVLVMIVLLAVGGCTCGCKNQAACPTPPQVAQAQSPAAK